MRFIVSIISTALVCYGGYWFWQNNPEVRGYVSDFVSKQMSKQELQTLELRYTSDQIMKESSIEMIKDRKRHYSEPELKLYPYVLLDVKFSENQEKTYEGSMLWSLVDGELVLNTKNWDVTHGYEDCIQARVTKAEFLLLNALAKAPGLVEKRTLLSIAGGDSRAIENTINSCKKKKLLVEHPGGLRLHFANPRLATSPSTIFDGPIMIRPMKSGVTMTSNYSVSQIKQLAESAFGKDFSIRNVREIYVPIYTFRTISEEGRVITTYWNAMNGAKVEMKDHHLQSTSNPLQKLIGE